MGKGKFIVIEGVEGAGKSRQCQILADALTARGIETVATREPGGDPLGEKLRELVLSPEYAPDAITELYMYSAARREHLNNVILPKLESGVTVVCDRFTFSTLAYQGYGRGLELDFVRNVNYITTKPLVIDLALFLDLPPEAGFERKGGADGGDRLERESMEFFERVYAGFKTMCDSGEIKAIDASGTKEETAAKILAAVEKIL